MFPAFALSRLRGRGSGPRSGRVRVFFFLLRAVEKKKTLTQPSPAKAGEGYKVGAMITHPTAQALVEGISAWLPLDGTASAFGLRVARNALEIAARDMALSPAADASAVDRMAAMLNRNGTRDDLDAALVEVIRTGVIAPDEPSLMAHMKACALDTLAIDQPRYAHELRL